MVQKILESAAGLLISGGWVQGKMREFGPNGTTVKSRCASAAIIDAGRDLRASVDDVEDTLRAVAVAAGEKIAKFNDRPEVTKTDVIEVFGMASRNLSLV